jgi:hypothetical protein
MKPGQKAIVTGLPKGFLDNLPQEDQAAITAILGKPIRFRGFDDAGRAELEFREADGTLHFIYLAQQFIGPATRRRR